MKVLKRNIWLKMSRGLILKTAEKAVVRYDQDTFITYFWNVFHHRLIVWEFNKNVVSIMYLLTRLLRQVIGFHCSSNIKDLRGNSLDVLGHHFFGRLVYECHHVLFRKDVSSSNMEGPYHCRNGGVVTSRELSKTREIWVSIPLSSSTKLLFKSGFCLKGSDLFHAGREQNRFCGACFSSDDLFPQKVPFWKGHGTP